MAVSPALFEELAKALARPSGAYRAATEALDIPKQALEGYRAGAQVGDEFRKRKFQQSSLSDVLGKQLPSNVPPDLTVEGADQLVKPIEAYAALEKASRENLPKPGENYNEEQTAAVASGDPARLAKAFGGVVPRTAVAANTTARGVTGKNDFFGTRTGQINLQQLPSELGPNTAAGAAFGVKIAARQGKALIANPGSSQKIGLASGDIARAVLRAAPQLDVIRGADFSQNLVTRLNSIQQRFTANPNGPDVPKLRREMYDILDELDKSATPFINNHLQNYESMLSPLSEDIKKRERGESLPDIPFNDGSGRKSYKKTAKNAQGVTIGTNDDWATFEPVQNGK